MASLFGRSGTQLLLSLLVLGSVTFGCSAIDYSLRMERAKARTHIGMAFEDAVQTVGTVAPSWANNTEAAQGSIELRCGQRDHCAIHPPGWPDNGSDHIDWQQYHVFVAFHRPPDGVLHLKTLYLIFDPETKMLIAKVALEESGLGAK